MRRQPAVTALRSRLAIISGQQAEIEQMKALLQKGDDDSWAVEAAADRSPDKALQGKAP